MTSEDEVYVASLKHTEEAQQIFNQAEINNSSAIFLKVKSERLNQVALTVIVQGYETISFNLTYEEYLTQKNNIFTQTMKMVSDAVAHEIKGAIFISHSPTSGNRIESIKVIDELENDSLDKLYVKPIIGPKKTKAKISFSPKQSRQVKLMNSDGQIYQTFGVMFTLLNTSKEEVIVSGDHFAIFFPSESLTSFPKHAVFVIDVGSMDGLELEQTKDVMITMLDSLTSDDHFSISTFHRRIYQWRYGLLTQATEQMKKEAIVFIKNLNSSSWSNINSALIAGIEAARIASASLQQNTNQFILLMTGGLSTISERDRQTILRRVKKNNFNVKVPIHGLVFGYGADYNFVKDVSDETGGKFMR